MIIQRTKGNGKETGMYTANNRISVSFYIIISNLVFNYKELLLSNTK